MKIQTYQGTCTTIPPDNTCLRNEVREIIGEEPVRHLLEHVALSAFFGEISAHKVVNLGGWHFTKEFNDARRPYHYDVQMDGTTLCQGERRLLVQAGDRVQRPLRRRQPTSRTSPARSA